MTPTGLPPVEPIPDEDHIARHCQPKDIDDGLDLPYATAFLRREDEASLSFGWLEYLKGQDLADCIQRLRQVLVDARRTVRTSHRLAVLRVGDVRDALRREPRIEVRHEPVEHYHAHAGILGCKVKDMKVAVILQGLVEPGDMYLAKLQQRSP